MTDDFLADAPPALMLAIFDVLDALPPALDALARRALDDGLVSVGLTEDGAMADVRIFIADGGDVIVEGWHLIAQLDASRLGISA